MHVLNMQLGDCVTF